MAALSESEIEFTAGEVLVTLPPPPLPVDPFAIARDEGIRLLAGHYDGCFDGRIEYRKNAGKGRFYLLYPDVQRPWRTVGRVRFSVAHELGHFYLTTHRDYLLSGHAHGSKADFLSNKQMEREADMFAAALLMPGELFAKRVERKSDGVCTLSDLLRISDEFQTSVTSTVMRYVQLNYEACGLIMTKDGVVGYSRFSEDMRRFGMGFVQWGHRLPITSIAGRMLSALRAEPNGPTRQEGRVDGEVWFDRQHGTQLWEEAMVLGRSGLVLSFLAVHSESRRDDDWDDVD